MAESLQEKVDRLTRELERERLVAKAACELADREIAKARRNSEGEGPLQATLSRLIAKSNARSVEKSGKPAETLVVRHHGATLPLVREVGKDFRKTRTEDVEKATRIKAKLKGETKIQRMNRVYRETGVHPVDQKDEN